MPCCSRQEYRGSLSHFTAIINWHIFMRKHSSFKMTCSSNGTLKGIGIKEYCLWLTIYRKQPFLFVIMAAILPHLFLYLPTMNGQFTALYAKIVPSMLSRICHSAIYRKGRSNIVPGQHYNLYQLVLAMKIILGHSLCYLTNCKTE